MNLKSSTESYANGTLPIPSLTFRLSHFFFVTAISGNNSDLTYEDKVAQRKIGCNAFM